MDGPVFTFLSKVADLVILNVLFLVCCIPIVTIGASATAMSYVSLKMVEGEDGYVFKSFFKSFKQNFRQSTLIWLIMLALALLLGLDFGIIRSLGDEASTLLWKVMQVAVFNGAFFWVMLFFYVFPVLARFDNTIIATMRNAMLMAFANAPKTLLTIATVVGMVLLTFVNDYTFSYGLLIWLMIGFAVLSYKQLYAAQALP